MSRKSLSLYKQYQKEHPEFFSESDVYPIIADQETLRIYEQAHHCDLGIVYRSRYYALCVDLIKGRKDPYTYSRILTIQAAGKYPVVMVPVFNGKFVLIHEYRHPARAAFWEFPRGFNEEQLKSEENAGKELKEELHASLKHAPVQLGLITPDAGIGNETAVVYLAEINEPSIEYGYEGIDAWKAVSLDELKQMIYEGKITDSFTISAFLRFLLRDEIKSQLGEDPLAKENNYYFISYARKDHEKTAAIAETLRNNNCYVWYDADIPVETQWKSVLIDRVKYCHAVVLMVSRESVRSSQVKEEINQARMEGKPLIPVFLENAVNLKPLGKENKEYIEKQEWVRMIRLDHKTLSELLNVMDKGRGTSKKLIRKEGAYIVSGASPHLKEDKSFYQAEMQDISDSAVSISELDNQWYPDGSDQALLTQRGSEERKKLKIHKEHEQAKELFRGLLHARQILLNRAFIQNSSLLVNTYHLPEDSNERKALVSLINDGSIMISLFKEDSPYPDQHQQGFQQKDSADVEAFLKKCRPYCLRLDWYSDGYNSSLCRELLSTRFQDFCMTIYTNDEMVNQWVYQYGIQDKKKFADKLKEVAEDAFNSVKNGKGYRRELFYQRFVVRDNVENAVVDSLVDPGKEYSLELKHIIDDKYCENFAYAYKCFLKRRNEYIHVPDELKSTNSREFLKRTVYPEEIIFAIEEIRTDQLKPQMAVIRRGQLSFERLRKIRQSEEWEQYMDSLEVLRGRSGAWDISFNRIIAICSQYHLMLEKLNKDDVAYVPSSFSILITIGKVKITLVLVYMKEWQRLYSVEGESEGTTAHVMMQFTAHDVFHENAESSTDASVLFFSGSTSGSDADEVKEIMGYLHGSSGWKERTGRRKHLNAM